MLHPRYLINRCFILGAAGALLLPAAVAVAVLLSKEPWPVMLTAVAVAAVFLYTGYRWVYQPYMDTERMLGLFADGYLFKDIEEIRHPLSRGMYEAIQKMKDMLDTNELISGAREQAQYIALQNQINPHFLYNTLEGIRGDALMAGMDNIANMTEALATFYRYTISNVDQLVTLEQELANVGNYYSIQQYRFGDRIALQIDCNEEANRCSIPKITLQPIIENAIIHGVERKMDKGRIRIKVEDTETRLIIKVSDNGVGMGQDQLDRLNRKLSTPSFDYEKPQGEERGGIAIVNVNNRIKLLFGEEYGVVIYSTPGIGTDVELTLPKVTE